VRIIHSVSEAFPAPYTTGLVELDDIAEVPLHVRPRILTNLYADDGQSSPQVIPPDGARVEVMFEAVGHDLAIPQFRVLGSEPFGAADALE
jgi:hypothetical protein